LALPALPIDPVARPLMPSWEYLIVALPEFKPAVTFQGQSASVQMLNSEGKNGWEAVGMTALEDGQVAVLMKRGREDEGDDEGA
jgi:hypothetical protein